MPSNTSNGFISTAQSWYRGGMDSTERRLREAVARLNEQHTRARQRAQERMNSNSPPPRRPTTFFGDAIEQRERLELEGYPNIYLNNLIVLCPVCGRTTTLKIISTKELGCPYCETITHKLEGNMLKEVACEDDSNS